MNLVHRFTMSSRLARLNTSHLKLYYAKGIRIKWIFGLLVALFMKWQWAYLRLFHLRKKDFSKKYCSSTSHGHVGYHQNVKTLSLDCWPKTQHAGWAADSQEPRSWSEILGSRKSTSANCKQGNYQHLMCLTHMSSKRTSNSNKIASTLKHKRVRLKMM